MLCCEITWGQGKESISCVFCHSALLYELVMIMRLDHECEFMSKSIWCNINQWVWRYNIIDMYCESVFMKILIYVILHGLCIVIEWNAIINM